MNQKKKSSPLLIVGLVLLVLVCFMGIQLIFAGLGEAIPNEARLSESQSSQQGEQASSAQDTSGAGEENGGETAPKFCPFCGENLPSAFQWGQFCPYCGQQIQA